MLHRHSHAVTQPHYCLQNTKGPVGLGKVPTPWFLETGGGKKMRTDIGATNVVLSSLDCLTALPTACFNLFLCRALSDSDPWPWKGKRREGGNERLRIRTDWQDVSTCVLYRQASKTGGMQRHNLSYWSAHDLVNICQALLNKKDFMLKKNFDTDQRPHYPDHLIHHTEQFQNLF